MNITTSLILVVVAIVVLAWNFYPPLRQRLRGWSTILEGLIGTGLTYFGIFAGAIQEGQQAGLIPENLSQYVPAILLAWVILKRIQAKTPVGKKHVVS